MASTLAHRIFLAHMELNYRLGRRVTLAEFGEMIAGVMDRPTPFTAAAVSRWEAGAQVPSTEVIEAIAALTQIDPGWLSHGEKSAAPAPERMRLADRLPTAPVASHKPAPTSSAVRAADGSREALRIRPKPE